jgi:hypothetical protein
LVGGERWRGILDVHQDQVQGKTQGGLGMSASLIALIPLVLFGLVTALCFVGCGLHTGGIPGPPNPLGPFEGDTVLADPSVVALWPLNDPIGSMTAKDVGPNNFTGTYNPPVALAQPGIVPKDVINGAQQNCAAFGGGFVSVPFQKLLNPGVFTLECWVQPEWAANDPAVKAVVISADVPQGSGFGIYASAGQWTAIVLLGPTSTPLTATLPVTFNNIGSYLAMTFDGFQLTLFVGPEDQPLIQSPPVNVPAGASFLQDTTTPLFIGMGRPDLPGGMNPFVGKIQDVAFYGSALNFLTLKSHFNAGTGAA